MNKNKKVNRFALSAIRGELLERETGREKKRERQTEREREKEREREREKERDPHNFEGKASMDHPIGEGWVNAKIG